MIPGYKVVSKMPTEGQFVQVWKFNDLIWSHVIRKSTYGYEMYDTQTDEWTDDFGFPGPNCEVFNLVKDV